MPVNHLLSYVRNLLADINDVKRLQSELVKIKRVNDHRNDFAKRYSCQYFSQSDEDGITLEICKRLGILERGTFIELGSGNGLENNSLILLAHGWRGVWADAKKPSIKASDNLSVFTSWLTLDNIPQLIKFVCEKLSPLSVDLISIDLDGNDIYLLESLINGGFHPKVIICEYNSFFPPSIAWKMPYDSNFNWKSNSTRDTYFGASLLAYVEMLTGYGYSLVACNPQTGVNAFFVRSEDRVLFTDASSSIEDIYVPPFYGRPHGANHIYNSSYRYLVSRSFVEAIISGR